MTRIIQGITIIEISARDLKFNTIVKQDIKYALLLLHQIQWSREISKNFRSVFGTLFLFDKHLWWRIEISKYYFSRWRVFAKTKTFSCQLFCKKNCVWNVTIYNSNIGILNLLFSFHITRFQKRIASREAYVGLFQTSTM